MRHSLFWKPIKWDQISTFIGSIVNFKKLVIHIEGLFNTCFNECFINGLKEATIAQVMMHCLETWLETCEISKGTNMVVIKKNTFTSYILVVVTIPEPSTS